MKEGEKNSSNFKKIFKKGVDKSKRMLYNRHIKFIPRQNPIVKIVAPGDQVFLKTLGAFEFYTKYLFILLSSIFTIGLFKNIYHRLNIKNKIQERTFLS